MENVQYIYNNTQIFLGPARSEAFGYAVAETAYCGCTVIASDIPGQNTMKDIPGIIWIPKENVTALEQAVIVALEDNNSDKTKTRRYIEKHYSLEEWALNILKIYGNT